MSLKSLPDDLLVEISSYVGSSSFSEIRKLRLVSKAFKRFCNERYVLHRLSLHEIPILPWSTDNDDEGIRFSRFFRRCRRYGNLEAIYRKGLIHYFYLDNHKQERRGIQRLAEAAKKGNQEARYVYGMILICLGGKSKQKGFKILSSLIKPFMSSTMKELKVFREKIRDHILWRGKPVMRQLKRSYVRDNCKCDGQTKKFLEIYNRVWKVYGIEDNDIISSHVCENCLWDSEVELFFRE